MSKRLTFIGLCLGSAASVARAEPRFDGIFRSIPFAFGPTFVACRPDSPTTAPTTAPTQAENAVVPLRIAMLKFEALRGKPSPTSRPAPLERGRIERAEAERDRAMQAAVDSMAGVSGRLSFRLVDVRERLAPMPPRASDAHSPGHAEIDRLALAEYEREVATLDAKPLVAVGEVALAASPEAEQLKVDLQNTVATANRESLRLRREFAGATSKEERDAIDAELKENEATRSERVASLRKQLAAASGTDDYVYVFGSADDFRLWHAGQTRAIVGRVDRVRVEIVPFGTGSKKVAVDAIVTAIAPATTRASEP